MGEADERVKIKTEIIKLKKWMKFKLILQVYLNMEF